ncbi:hypothetical protein [Rhodococcus sp. NBC_00297]|uniref:hypothetical protein n=1 Tax=Rhodococcus sp. NBC_00297 TaxID=2976005 RepID=UPI002E2E684D|nr:hypothetical protein [Rhodococcus sp. NBC_00297]
MVVCGPEIRILEVVAVAGEDKAGAVVVTVHGRLDGAGHPVVPAGTPRADTPAWSYGQVV